LRNRKDKLDNLNNSRAKSNILHRKYYESKMKTSSARTRNIGTKDLVNSSIKNFETHHVTIDLNYIDPQSTLQSTNYKDPVPTDQPSPTTTHGKISRMMDKGDLENVAGMTKKAKIKMTPKKHLTDSPVKEFIQNTLRDEYIIHGKFMNRSQ